MAYPRIATLKTPADFQTHLERLAIDLPFDEQVETGSNSPLGQPYHRGEAKIGNRFCILPMEGWDGTTDGRPSDLTRRRWRNFGLSGAKLIWGGEAVAVRSDGRANPNQLVLNDETLAELASLRTLLVEVHETQFGCSDDLLIGLQLTHSGRFARPHGKKLEPRVLYRHPLLDQRSGVIDDAALFSDDEIDRLIDDFVKAARLARQAGFQFVDIKACHGYLGHEFLSAVDRPGRYGGSLENRTRFLRMIVEGIRSEAPGLEIGVRLSIFDFLPFQPGDDFIGQPAPASGPYHHAFGGSENGLEIDLAEPRLFLDILRRLEVDLFCSTAGSPYYNPHIQRPALFPPSDGYQPPEDPLVGVARQISATAALKRDYPELLVVGSGYSYLQEWLPNVGQRVVRQGGADFVGLGRMVLSYPEMPADILAGRSLARKKICRTFSDCTTAPRNGMVSGCYPLDTFYKDRPERARLTAIKEKLGEAKS